MIGCSRNVPGKDKTKQHEPRFEGIKLHGIHKAL
jgi:hypothetical protein